MATLRNPFVISGIIPDEYFCDREAETKKIIGALTNENNIVLVSQRRMGKTGLINHCFGQPELSKDYITLFVDILATSSLNEFTYLLGKEVFRQLLPAGKKMAALLTRTLRSLSGKFGFDPLTNLPTFNIEIGDITSPVNTLDEIFEVLGNADRRCIVAIDEFQQIANYREKNIEAMLRTHIQRCSNCNFIFAGSERSILEEMFVNSARPFYNSSHMIELNEIPLETYTGFASRLFNLAGKEVESTAITATYEKVRGNTFMLQRILNKCFADTPTGGKCDETVCNAAIDELIADNTFRFQEQMSNLSHRQKPLLYAIAAEESASAITSGAFVKKYSLNSPSSVQSAAKALTERGLITVRHGQYSLTDPLLALWIRRTFFPT